MRSPILAGILGFACWGSLAAARAQPAGEACAACHTDQVKQLPASAHAQVGCATCHTGHEAYPHPAGALKPRCATCHSAQAGEHAASVHGQLLRQGNQAAPTCGVCHGDPHTLKDTRSATFHQGIPDTCGMCHTEIADQFKASVHGQAVARGIPEAPVCTTCHGEHQILSPKAAASSVNPRHIHETCGQCHGNVKLSARFGLPTDRIVSFDESFHGLAARAGSQTVANCASCHGVHTILPSSDPRSMVSVRNLPKTCGRCHPGAGTRFAIGPVHQLAGRSESPAVYWVRVGYIILIPLLVGLMLVHNLGDWLRKLFERRFQPAAARRWPGPWMPRQEIRMYRFERIQHALLVLSFLTLVWTGFALKYPDQWWARPLVAWEQYFPVRGVVHRVAAAVLIAIAGVHALSLLTCRRLREHWKLLWPRRDDLPEALLNFAYNLGLLKRRPGLSSHSYIGKVEYWAVVWGTAIMGATGVLLWANNLTLHYLPKTALDFATTVHFYEAVLATLSILVWHFYGVIFDPDVYPLETAFLTGISVKEEHTAAEAEPAEPEGAQAPGEPERHPAR
ncbi:MAG: cytochrome b/b6 domain-containing protein [Bryobacteraceae bacterium]|jgi:cytochrome b subunit of formate dehydrogenase